MSYVSKENAAKNEGCGDEDMALNDTQSCFGHGTIRHRLELTLQ